MGERTKGPLQRARQRGVVPVTWDGDAKRFVVALRGVVLEKAANPEVGVDIYFKPPVLYDVGNCRRCSDSGTIGTRRGSPYGRKNKRASASFRVSGSATDVALGEFSCGSSAHPPSQHILSVACRLSEAVIASTIEPEITVDVDGALAFDLRLKSGLLMFAELQVDGSLSLTVLDDSGKDTSVVQHVPTATGPQFLELL